MKATLSFSIRRRLATNLAQYCVPILKPDIPPICPSSSGMPGVRHNNVQFFLQTSSLLFKCHITLNAIRRRAIQLPGFRPLPHVIVLYPSSRAIRSQGTMQSHDSTPRPAQSKINRLVLGSRLAGESGRKYLIKSVLQEKDHRPERVYLASYVVEHSISSRSLFVQLAYLVFEIQHR